MKDRERHERAFLDVIREVRSHGLPAVREPDRHLEAPEGCFRFGSRVFPFAWDAESVLVVLDRTNPYPWGALEAQALGWTVLFITPEMVRDYPERVLQALSLVVGCEAGKLEGVLAEEEIEDQEALLRAREH